MEKYSKRKRYKTNNVYNGLFQQDQTNSETANDEKALSEEKMKLTQELRDGLALETKVLMEQQDTNLAELIGRLQVNPLFSIRKGDT